MEPVSLGQGSAHVAAVSLPVQWRDVGGYASLAEILTTDAAGNAVSGLSVALDASDNVVVNAEDGSVIGLLGVSGLVIVRTPTGHLGGAGRGRRTDQGTGGGGHGAGRPAVRLTSPPAAASSAPRTDAEPTGLRKRWIVPHVARLGWRVAVRAVPGDGLGASGV